jgi:hypothetical protein
MEYLIAGAVCAAGLAIPIVLGFAQQRGRSGRPGR